MSYLVCVMCPFIYLSVFCNVSICNLSIKLGFRLGKSRPYALCLEVTFQGPNSVCMGQLVYLVYLTCEIRCDQHISVIRTCFVCLFSFFSYNESKLTIARGYNNTIGQ